MSSHEGQPGGGEQGRGPVHTAAEIPDAIAEDIEGLTPDILTMIIEAATGGDPGK